jgi:hypothetical protein
VTFLSDGGDDVRQVQQYLNPEAEYWLDWFHITMRITVMKQMARGLAKETKTSPDITEEPAAEPKEKGLCAGIRQATRKTSFLREVAFG